MFAGYPYQRTDYQNSSEYYLFLCSLGSEVLGAMVAVFLRQTYSTNINKDTITSTTTITNSSTNTKYKCWIEHDTNTLQIHSTNELKIKILNKTTFKVQIQYTPTNTKYKYKEHTQHASTKLQFGIQSAN